MAKTTKPGGGSDGNGSTGKSSQSTGKPSQKHGNINAAEGVGSAQQAISKELDQGHVGSSGRSADQNNTTPTKRDNTQSQGSVNLEGKRELVVDDPKDPGRTITDIDHIENGVLWEEKSAVTAADINKWISKHIYKKFNSYLDARQYIPGYEQAPIGFRFTNPGADPAFKAAVESAVAKLRADNPGVKIIVEWAQ
ncbi:MAG TPA: hypothetical protein VIL00_07955 [Pseudonocardiaceae bacterium]